MRKYFRNITYNLLSKLPKGNGIHIILVYHAVGENLPQSVDKNDFYRQMLHLQKNFSVVELKDLFKAAKNKQNKNFVSLTFDDGYLTDFQKAVPILEEFNFPATFFIPTKYIGAEFSASSGTLPVMNEKQIKLLDNKGFEVGSHTVTHRNLLNLSKVEILKELEDSKSTLLNLTTQKNLSFAYPEGRYNDNIVNIVQKAGYNIAVTTDERIINKDNQFLLPRISINQQLNFDAFSVKTSHKLKYLNKLKSLRFM